MKIGCGAGMFVNDNNECEKNREKPTAKREEFAHLNLSNANRVTLRRKLRSHRRLGKYFAIRQAAAILCARAVELNIATCPL